MSLNFWFKAGSISIAILGWAIGAHSASGGNSSGGFLLRSPGARSAGMAEAYSSFGADFGGIEALPYNPASPAFLDAKQISLMGNRGFSEDNYGNLLFGAPTAFGSISAQFLYYSLGDIDLIDQNGVTRTVKAEEDLSIGAGYSDRFLVDFLATGLSLKFLRSTLVKSESSNAWAADVGLQARFLEDRLAFGLSYLNLGSQLTYLGSGESLPSTLRVGASYSFITDPNGKAKIAADIVQTRDEKLKQYLGGEYTWNRRVAFRAGYKNGQDQGKLNFGVGFILNRFQLDYAFTEAGKLGTLHSFSLGAKFGRQRGDGQSFDSGVRNIKRKRPPAQTDPSQKSLLILDVQPLSDNAVDAADFAKALRDHFERRNKSFIIVPRNRVLELLKDQGRANSSCNDLHCAQEMGAVLGAGHAVVSSLSTFGKLYSYSVRMIDLRSSKVEYVETGEASSMQELGENARKIVDKLLLLSQ